MESFIFKCLFFFNLGFDKRCQRTFVLLETSALMSFCINETRRETAAVKKIKRSESNVSEQIYQCAHTLIVWLCLFVRLITSRCQLQGSGTAGLKTAPATRNMPGSREVPAGPACLWVSGASGTSEAHWLLVMCSSAQSHTLRRANSQTTHHAHMFMHYFYTIAHVRTCIAHCIKAGTHNSPYVRTGMTELTIQTKKEKSQT